MVSEAIEVGYIEANAHSYELVASLGVPARVWDEVIAHDYILAHPTSMPGAFGYLSMDWMHPQLRNFDYTRAEGISDHEYVRGLFDQVEAFLTESREVYPDLHPDARYARRKSQCQ